MIIKKRLFLKFFSCFWKTGFFSAFCLFLFVWVSDTVYLQISLYTKRNLFSRIHDCLHTQCPVKSGSDLVLVSRSFSDLSWGSKKFFWGFDSRPPHGSISSERPWSRGLVPGNTCQPLPSAYGISQHTMSLLSYCPAWNGLRMTDQYEVCECEL